jgi:hypothetical protein
MISFFLFIFQLGAHYHPVHVGAVRHPDRDRRRLSRQRGQDRPQAQRRQKFRLDQVSISMYVKINHSLS